MKPTTRQRILGHIRKHQTATVRELSLLMGLTGANIRHHLTILEDNVQIETVGVRSEGRGRPMQIFGLSRRVLGDGLDNLTGALLDLWLGRRASEKQEADLKALARRIGGESEFNLPIMKRLEKGEARLNELHYQARWEASVAGPRFILGHCPYAAIITEHPELCRMDAFLIETLFGGEVEQTEKLQLSHSGLPFCTFLMVE